VLSCAVYNSLVVHQCKAVFPTNGVTEKEIGTLVLGLFVSTISSTQQQAMMTAQFFILQPMMYLSGFTFPIENMPHILQYISYAIPMSYYLVIMRAIILKGVGISSLWIEAGALLVMGVVILFAVFCVFERKWSRKN
jgi:ABC-2 type transport system permease protein